MHRKSMKKTSHKKSSSRGRRSSGMHHRRSSRTVKAHQRRDKSFFTGGTQF